MKFSGDAPTNQPTLATILGISNEAALFLLSEGHVVISEAKKHTFFRLRDMYQSQRKTLAARAIKTTS